MQSLSRCAFLRVEFTLFILIYIYIYVYLLECLYIYIYFKFKFLFCKQRATRDASVKVEVSFGLIKIDR